MNSATSKVSTSVQPAQTGGIITSCPLGASGKGTDAPLFSQERRHLSRSVAAIVNRAITNHPPRANKSQVPDHLRKSGRLFVNCWNGKANYIGRNAGRVCEICGDESEVTTDSDGPVWLQKFLLALARKRVHRKLGKEIPCMKKPQEYAGKLAKLPDRIAAILAKTVAVQGDAFELDDAEALMRIYDVINELDSELIQRNANKKLARPRRSS